MTITVPTLNPTQGLKKLVENEKPVPDLDQELAIIWTHDEFVTYSHLDDTE